MKDKTNNVKKKIKNESGLVIVEAAIVFPVMFFVLLFIIFIGNMYFEQAKVDNIVATYAVKGAQYIADPSLYEMDENGGIVPRDVKNTDVEPYRMVIGAFSRNGSVAQLEDAISQKVKEEIGGGLIFFSNSNANIVGSDNSKIAKFKSYIVYSTFTVQVNYEIKFPIRFLGEEAPTIVKMSSRSEVAVNDTPEFIRNIDMVVDLLDGTKLAETVQSMFTKINTFIKKFS